MEKKTLWRTTWLGIFVNTVFSAPPPLHTRHRLTYHQSTPLCFAFHCRQHALITDFQNISIQHLFSDHTKFVLCLSQQRRAVWKPVQSVYICSNGVITQAHGYQTRDIHFFSPQICKLCEWVSKGLMCPQIRTFLDQSVVCSVVSA